MTEDPYLWLEDVTGDDALDWVRARNEPTLAELSATRVRADAHRGAGGARHRRPHPLRASAAASTSTTSGATRPTRAGCGGAPRWSSYRTESPEWEVLIDVDELGRRRRRELGVGRRRCHRARIHPCADQPVPRRVGCLHRAGIRHAHTGIRRRRVRAAGSQVAGRLGRPDTVLVGTDFGADSLTESGYPRMVKRWRRGTPLADAETVFEGARSDVTVGGERRPDPRLRAHADRPGPGLLERRGLRAARLGAAFASTRPPTPSVDCTASGC